MIRAGKAWRLQPWNTLAHTWRWEVVPGKYLQPTGVTAGLSRMLGKELPEFQCSASTGLVGDHCSPQGYVAMESD